MGNSPSSGSYFSLGHQAEGKESRASTGVASGSLHSVALCSVPHPRDGESWSSCALHPAREAAVTAQALWLPSVWGFLSGCRAPDLENKY